MSSVVNKHADSGHWPHPAGGCDRPATALVVVDGIADVARGAVEYALALQPARCLAVHVRRSRREAASISRAWAAFHPAIPLGVIDRGVGSVADALMPVVANQQPTTERPVVIVCPNDLVGASELAIGEGAFELGAAFHHRDDVLVVLVSPLDDPT